MHHGLLPELPFLQYLPPLPEREERRRSAVEINQNESESEAGRRFSGFTFFVGKQIRKGRSQGKKTANPVFRAKKKPGTRRR